LEETYCRICQSAISCRTCASHFPEVDGEIVFIPFYCSAHRSTAVQAWFIAQRRYQGWQSEYTIENAESDREIADEIHGQLHLDGAVLDIGGNAGLVRRHLAPNQFYLSIDPDTTWRQKLDVFRTVYPELTWEFSHLQALAEHLPIASNSFDSVLMRAVLDHLYDVHLALSEVMRVLALRGRVVVGLSVDERQPSPIQMLRHVGPVGLARKVRRRLAIARRHGKHYGTGHVFQVRSRDVVPLLAEHGLKVTREVRSSINPQVIFYEARAGF
jgi:SAM-dependent methyltransferase